ncbi:GntR family transcriptional regulator [Brachyspira catarrhinii]|uniref:GntR family transcriptional regulator n=1 Tax=Brachyspira catarrhinii TaxID=2528966 RepID=A0ABY2TS40_9SPIR|nr:GntR family transcriptional regulator [Brachyspira catarrhinii]TKZ35687.1 GntR family transcriptional regulator [Brachyspira catarrhinii]
MSKLKNNDDNLKKFKTLKKEKNESVGDYAVRVIEYNIINMSLPPGTFISEKIISDMLDISRTPVREAFSRLEKANFIEIYPQKASRVSLIDIDIIDETSFIRRTLEKEIIKTVCEKHSVEDLNLLSDNISQYKKNMKNDDLYKLLNIDNNFHKILFLIANKKLTYNIIKDSIKHFNRERIFNIMEMDRSRILKEHQDIFQAIKEKNSKKAISLIETHLTHVTEDLEFLKSKFPNYFKD